MSSLSASRLFNRLLSRGKLRHLQVLMQLAELGSVQRTAQSIGMTQSAVTQNLAYLEQLLETPLFIRHARGVMPTPACQALLPTVRQLMLGMAQGADVLASVRQEGRLTLRLLASSSGMQGLLVGRMSEFVQTHPDIRIELSEAEGEDLLLAASRLETDLVVCRRPSVIPTGWTFVDLMPDRFVVAAAPGDAWADQGPWDWDDLQGRQWLLSSVHTQARQRFDALCESWLEPPHYYPVVTRALPMSAQLIRAHHLLGFMPDSSLQPLFDQGLLVRLDVRVDLSMLPIGILQPLAGLRESAARMAQFLEQSLRQDKTATGRDG